MKTKPNLEKVLAVTLLYAISMIPGNNLSAQSDADDPSSEEIMLACEQLEAFCAACNKSLKYVAPFDDDFDVEAAIERLEMLAKKIENQIRYRPPDFESIPENVTDSKPVPLDLLTQKRISRNNQF